MKRTLFLSLSALALSLTTAPVFAGEIAAVNTQSVNNIVEITPFNLVRRGYQGSLEGIKSAGSFVRAANSGRVTAEDLVEVAIADGRLDPETINDREYLRNVTSHLRNLDND
ncbi:MAG: hypothetical protein QNJ72_35270 [Pleurocapsa sp. MO_226.B13]|nr:hypothetical protein [Pleurocapsa sp. MO_226.B13]